MATSVESHTFRQGTMSGMQSSALLPSISHPISRQETSAAATPSASSHGHLTPASNVTTAASGGTRVKRKPPPTFPYSSKYPAPDPSEPLASLATLRVKASESQVALNSGPLNSPEYSNGLGLRMGTPNTATALMSPYTPGTHDTGILASPPRTANTDTQKPWFGLAKGYLTELVNSDIGSGAKPSRPPRSKKRGDSQERQVYQEYPPPTPQKNPPPTQPQNSTSNNDGGVSSRRRGSSIQQRAQDEAYKMKRRSQSVPGSGIPSGGRPGTSGSTTGGENPAAPVVGKRQEGTAVAQARVKINDSARPKVEPKREVRHEDSKTKPKRSQTVGASDSGYTYADRQSHGFTETFSGRHATTGSVPTGDDLDDVDFTDYGRSAKPSKHHTQPQPTPRRTHRKESSGNTTLISTSLGHDHATIDIPQSQAQILIDSPSTSSSPTVASVTIDPRSRTPPMTPDESDISSRSASPHNQQPQVNSRSTSPPTTVPAPVSQPEHAGRSRPIPIPREQRISTQESGTPATTDAVLDEPVRNLPPSIESEEFAVLQRVAAIAPPASALGLVPNPSSTPAPPAAKTSVPPTSGPLATNSNTRTQPIPPSPSRHSSLLYNQPTASNRARQVRHNVESDPEAPVNASNSNATSPIERWRRTGGFRRRRQTSTGGGITIRGKTISNPSPKLLPAAAASASSLSLGAAPSARASETDLPTTIPPTPASPEPHSNADLRATAPRPRKSLSHVSLGLNLKVLPNLSLAPTIDAPSPNASMASGAGIPGLSGISLLRPPDGTRRGMGPLPGATVPTSHITSSVTGARPGPGSLTVNTRVTPQHAHLFRYRDNSSLSSFSGDDEPDPAAYSVFSNFTQVLSPITSVAGSSSAGPNPRESGVWSQIGSQIGIPTRETSPPLPELPRRGSGHSSIQGPVSGSRRGNSGSDQGHGHSQTRRGSDQSHTTGRRGSDGHRVKAPTPPPRTESPTPITVPKATSIPVSIPESNEPAHEFTRQPLSSELPPRGRGSMSFLSQGQVAATQVHQSHPKVSASLFKGTTVAAPSQRDEVSTQGRSRTVPETREREAQKERNLQRATEREREEREREAQRIERARELERHREVQRQKERELREQRELQVQRDIQAQREREALEEAQREREHQERERERERHERERERERAQREREREAIAQRQLELQREREKEFQLQRERERAKEADDTGYLPVAQLPTSAATSASMLSRPGITRQATATSQTSQVSGSSVGRHRTGSSRGHGYGHGHTQTLATQVEERIEVPEKAYTHSSSRRLQTPEPTFTRAQSPELTDKPQPPRARILEPPLAVPVPAHLAARAQAANSQLPGTHGYALKGANLKDLDSPLPPPPTMMDDTEREEVMISPPPRSSSRMAHLQAQSQAQARASPIPSKQNQNSTRTTPIPSSQPAPISPPISPPASLPKKQRTAPSTPGLTSPSFTSHSHSQSHSHSHSHYPPRNRSYDYADEDTHGSACSPTSKRGHGMMYPPGDFDEHALPSDDQLRRAAQCMVVSESGVRFAFGDLLKDRRTIVIFIRHFWCPMCQDYMYSISRNVDPESLRRAGIDVVIIGNGSPAMIRSYRSIFRTTFPLYTDPSLALHAALGMTHRSSYPGPDREKGSYVRHGAFGGFCMIVKNALKSGMSIWDHGGDSYALGGEFVLGPGLTCTYAHRMKNTRDHAPITDILAAAEVPVYMENSALPGRPPVAERGLSGRTLVSHSPQHTQYTSTTISKRQQMREAERERDRDRDRDRDTPSRLGRGGPYHESSECTVGTSWEGPTPISGGTDADADFDEFDREDIDTEEDRRPGSRLDKYDAERAPSRLEKTQREKEMLMQMRGHSNNLIISQATGKPRAPAKSSTISTSRSYKVANPDRPGRHRSTTVSTGRTYVGTVDDKIGGGKGKHEVWYPNQRDMDESEMRMHEFGMMERERERERERARNVEIDRDDAYALTQEVLAYSFRRNIN